MALTKIPSSLLDTSGGFDLQGNITLGDSEKIILGDSSDLKIQHNGTNSFIDNETGGLFIRNKADDRDVDIQSDDGSGGLANYFRADGSTGSAILYNYGDTKLETTSTGATVTGVLTATSVNTGQGDYELYAMDQNVRTTDSPAFAAATINGTLTVTGDLDITGDINSYNVTDLDVTDQTITLGAGQTEANSGGSGIIIDGSSASLLWNETNSQFDFNKTVNVTSGNMKIDGNQVGLNHIAHGIASGNSVANNFQIGRWKGSTFDRWMLVPVNNGSEQYSDEFGYNFSTGAWFFDDKVGIGTSNPDYKLEVVGDSLIGDATAVTSPSFSAQQQIVKSFTHGSTGIGRGGNLYLLNTNTTGEAGFLAFGAYYNNTNNLYYQTSGIGGGKETSTGDGAWGGYLSFWTTSDGTAGAASGQFEHMRITADGKVGINQSSPSKLLHVQSDTDYEGIIIKGAGHKQLTIESTSSSRQALTTFQTGSQNMSIGLDTDNAFIFHSGTAGSERMQIDSSGNLLVNQTSAGVNGKLQVTGGIGLTGNSEIRQSTNSDGSTLRFLGTQFVAGSTNAVGYSYSSGAQIASVSNSANVILFEAGASNTSGHRLTIQNDATGLQGEVKYAGSEPVFILRDTRNAGGTAWSDSANEPLGEIEFWTSDATGIGPHAVARIRTVNDITAASPAGAITFMTSGYNNGSPTEKMRISSSGRLLVDTTSIGNASTNAKVVCDSEFLARGSSAGFFWENRTGMTIASQSGWGGWYSTGTASHFLYSDGANRASIGRTSGTYTALSDVNKKKDFEDSTVGLAEVMQLQPKKFRMLDDADDAPKKLGFVAQDVENVIPEAYVEDLADDENEETFIGLTDRPIIAALTKAIQELKTELDAAKARITELEG